MIMKELLTAMELRYMAPRAEVYVIEHEGVLCESDTDSDVSGDTGASWKDETDASLPW